MDSLQHFKKPFAHEHEPVDNLLDAVKVNITSSYELLHTIYLPIHSHIVIYKLWSGYQTNGLDRNIWCWQNFYKGNCGGNGISKWGSLAICHGDTCRLIGRVWGKNILTLFMSGLQKPLILALSNPTSQAECTAEDAYTWSKVRKCTFSSKFILA